MANKAGPVAKLTAIIDELEALRTAHPEMPYIATIAKGEILLRAALKASKRPASCQLCGAKCTPEGHHHDYSKPFDVAWLCYACHIDHHKRMKERAKR